MYQYQFARPSNTASVIAFRELGLPESQKFSWEGPILTGVKVCLIRRGADPFAGHLALPGGFQEVLVKTEDFAIGSIHPEMVGETLEHCAARELYEECNLVTLYEHIRLVCVHSSPTRDPRGHVVDHVYAARFEEVNTFEDIAKAGDDASSIEMMEFRHGCTYPKTMFAFDHGESLACFFSNSFHQLKIHFS